MAGRRITYDNELEIMIEDYLANPLEAELERVIEGLEEEELAERKAKVQAVLEGREKFEIPSAQILHNIMEVWRAFRPSVYKKLKHMEIMPLEAERLLQEQGRIIFVDFRHNTGTDTPAIQGGEPDGKGNGRQNQMLNVTAAHDRQKAQPDAHPVHQ